jgi:hypothetical protein
MVTLRSFLGAIKLEINEDWVIKKPVSEEQALEI